MYLSFDRTRVIPFGPGSYARVLEAQRALAEQRRRGATPDAILLGEHERVITLGRGVKEPVALELPVVAVERGGLATWHGPGQLVGYPILALGDLGIGVREYLRGLEQALIDALAEYGVAAGRRAGATGVWVDAHKIASIGVAVRRGVSLHGFALNVAPDLADFALIEPCGFPAEVMTSLARVLDRPPGLADVTLRVLRALVHRFHLAPPVWEKELPVP